jgi:ribosome assembly protein 1
VPLPDVGNRSAAVALGLLDPGLLTSPIPSHPQAPVNQQSDLNQQPGGNAGSNGVETVAAAATASEGGQEAGGDSSAAQQLAHICACTESGLSAGFQLATSAGPLCEEPLWGVVFEVDVRLALPQWQAGGDGAESNTGVVVAAAVVGDGGRARLLQSMAGLDLQEDVYGPFSGQVRVEATFMPVQPSASVVVLLWWWCAWWCCASTALLEMKGCVWSLRLDYSVCSLPTFLNHCN